MKRKTTNLMAIAVSVLMLFALLPAMAFAVEPDDVCEIDGIGYATLGVALATVQNGETKTIKLLEDITHDQRISVGNGETIIFDLNGKILNATGGLNVSGASTQILLADPYNGEFNVSRSNSAAFPLNVTGGFAEVTNVISYLDYDAVVISVGEAIVYGDVTVHSESPLCRGAYVYNGGKLTVEGKITVPDVGVYIRFSGTDKTKADYEPNSSKPGYHEYNLISSTYTSYVWVKIDPCDDGHDWGDWAITTPAACEEDGEETRVCANDPAHFETKPVDAPGHDYVGVVTDPTCADGGYTTYTCSRCDDWYIGDYTDADPCGDCEYCNPEVVITGVSGAKFISIVETAKNSRVWLLTFEVTVEYSDGTSAVERYTALLVGNNANLSGKYAFDDGHDLAGYTLSYDIKGNGSNIKAFDIN